MFYFFPLVMLFHTSKEVLCGAVGNAMAEKIVLRDVSVFITSYPTRCPSVRLSPSAHHLPTSQIRLSPSQFQVSLSLSLHSPLPLDSLPRLSLLSLLGVDAGPFRNDKSTASSVKALVEIVEAFGSKGFRHPSRPVQFLIPLHAHRQFTLILFPLSEFILCNGLLRDMRSLGVASSRRSKRERRRK